MAARRMAERIEETVAGLSDHPELGRPGRVPQTRELIVPGTPYIVPYLVKEDVVEILTVLHAARRWPDQF
jgi:toxin ParE1/3/4